jgi:hypothetical protein
MRLRGSDIKRLAGIKPAGLTGMEYFEGPGGRIYLLGFERRHEIHTEVWYRVRLPLIARDQQTVEVAVTRDLDHLVGRFEMALEQLRYPAALDPVVVRHALGMVLADLNPKT